MAVAAPTPLCTLLLPLSCRPVGIVQQNQIKKARKIQDDIRAEHERLVVGHLSRLRRAAAAELQADSAAKQVTMAWLQVCMSSGLNRSSYWGAASLLHLPSGTAAELHADLAAKQVTMAWLQVCTS